MRPSAGLGLVLACVVAATAGYFGWPLLRPAGAMAPPLTFTDIEGRSRSLSEWRGKPVLINFWATWCAPCLEEIPMLMEAQRELAGSGLSILGLAVDEAPAVRRFQAQRNLNYPVFPGTDAAIAAMDALGDTRGALPFSVFIAPDGKIVGRHAGVLRREVLEAWLEPYR